MTNIFYVKSCGYFLICYLLCGPQLICHFFFICHFFGGSFRYIYMSWRSTFMFFINRAMAYFLSLLLLFESSRSWGGDQSKEVDKVIEAGLLASQGQMEILWSKIAKGIPEKSRDFLILHLEEEIQNFYDEEKKRLSSFVIPFFSNQAEAVVYRRAKEQELIKDLKNLQENIQKLKAMETSSISASAYRTSGKELDTFQPLVYELSKNSQAIISRLHELQLFDKKINPWLAEEKLFKQVLKGMYLFWQSIMTISTLYRLTHVAIKENAMWHYSAASTMSTSMLITFMGIIATIPYSVMISAAFTFPAYGLVSKVRAALLANGWRERAWNSQLKEVGKIDKDFELMLRGFIADANCKAKKKANLKKIRVDESISAEIEPPVRFRIDTSTPGPQVQEALEEMVEDIPPPKMKRVFPRP